MKMRSDSTSNKELLDRTEAAEAMSAVQVADLRALCRSRDPEVARRAAERLGELAARSSVALECVRELLLDEYLPEHHIGRNAARTLVLTDAEKGCQLAAEALDAVLSELPEHDPRRSFSLRKATERAYRRARHILDVLCVAEDIQVADKIADVALDHLSEPELATVCAEALGRSYALKSVSAKAEIETWRAKRGAEKSPTLLSWAALGAGPADWQAALRLIDSILLAGREHEEADVARIMAFRALATATAGSSSNSSLAQKVLTYVAQELPHADSPVCVCMGLTAAFYARSANPKKALSLAADAPWQPAGATDWPRVHIRWACATGVGDLPSSEEWADNITPVGELVLLIAQADLEDAEEASHADDLSAIFVGDNEYVFPGLADFTRKRRKLLLETPLRGQIVDCLFKTARTAPFMLAQDAAEAIGCLAEERLEIVEKILSFEPLCLRFTMLRCVAQSQPDIVIRELERFADVESKNLTDASRAEQLLAELAAWHPNRLVRRPRLLRVGVPPANAEFVAGVLAATADADVGKAMTLLDLMPADLLDPNVFYFWARMASTGPAARMAEAYRRCLAAKPISTAVARQLCADILDGLEQGSQSDPVRAIRWLTETIMGALDVGPGSPPTAAVLERLARCRLPGSVLGRCRAAARDALAAAIALWQTHGGEDVSVMCGSHIAGLRRRLAHDTRAFVETVHSEVRDGTLYWGFGPDRSTVYYPPETRLACIALGAIIGSAEDVCADAMSSRRAALAAQSSLNELYEGKEFESLAEEAGELLSAWPDLAALWGLYGLSLVELDRASEAIEAQEKALSMSDGPGAAPHYYNLACAHARAGSSAQAKNALEQAIAIVPARYRGLAVDDPDFEQVRKEPWFRELVNIDHFLQDLDADDQGLRRNAVDAIGILADRKAEPALACIVRDPEESAQLRAAAIDALKAVLGAEAVDLLRDLIADADGVEIRLTAARALASLGGEGLAVLLEEIRKLPEEDQASLVKALSASNAPENFDALVDFAMSGPEEVSKAAVDTLRSMARRPPDFEVLHEDAIEALKRIAEEADAPVRASSITALASLRAPDLADVVRPAVEAAVPEVRAAAAHALLQFEDPEREARLKRLLRDNAPLVRQAAKAVWGLIGKPEIPQPADEAEGPDAGRDEST